MVNISIDQLADQIAKELETYSDNVIKGVNESSEKVGEAAVKKLKATAPKRTGKYGRSWRIKTFKMYGQPDTRIIHAAKPGYRLAHLLEHGHAKRGGGRVKAIPHIKPVEDELIEDFTKGVEEAIKNG